MQYIIESSLRDVMKPVFKVDFNDWCGKAQAEGMSPTWDSYGISFVYFYATRNIWLSISFKFLSNFSYTNTIS